MNDDVVIRLSEPEDRDRVLRFIREMEFNARDATTWDALQMCAMTAWRQGELVGAIPLEPRTYQWAPNREVRSVHETVVAVRPDLRGFGIGSRMQDAIAATRPCGAQVATVYRELPESGAYRWYRKNRFEPVMHIVSWLWEGPFAGLATGQSERVGELDATGWTSIRDIFQQRVGGLGGYVQRRLRPLREWLPVHPYRARYEMWMFQSADRNSYALYGLSRMHSDVLRLDVLEACGADTEGLIQGLLHEARRHDCEAMRFAMAECDPRGEVALAKGGKSGWNFDMMVRALDNESAPLATERDHFRYFTLDYI